ncbi:hypothetical protein GW932_01860 [archaeon]|nr:hypothetical protein [archaeon]
MYKERKNKYYANRNAYDLNKAPGFRKKYSTKKKTGAYDLNEVGGLEKKVK